MPGGEVPRGSTVALVPSSSHRATLASTKILFRIGCAAVGKAPPAIIIVHCAIASYHPPVCYRERTSDAALATCALRHAARDLLPQRSGVEPAAAGDARGGTGGRRAQGSALGDRPGGARPAVHPRTRSGGGPDHWRTPASPAPLFRRGWRRP